MNETLSATYTGYLSNDSRYYITLTVEETEYSVINNTSDVYYALTATKTSGSGYYDTVADNPVKVSINGTEVVNKNVAYDFTGSTPKTITLASGTVEGIEHNDDGKKTISVSGYFSADSRGSATASGQFTLTELPRTSELWVEYGTFYTNDSVEITVVKTVETYTDKLEIMLGDTVIRTVNSIDGVYQVLLTTNEVKTILSNLGSSESSFTLTYKLTTSSGSTVIGTREAEVDYNVYFTAEMQPTFTDFDYKDTNTTTKALTGNDQKLILGYSELEYSIPSSKKATPASGYGTTMSKYVIDEVYNVPYADSVTYNAGTVTDNTLNVKAVDSRGASKTVIKIATSINNYHEPKITTETFAEREGAVGESVTLKLVASLWDGNFGANANAISKFEYRVKEKTSTTWTDWLDATATLLNYVSNINNIDIEMPIYLDGTSTNFATGVAYDLQIRITDGTTAIPFNTTQYNTIIDDGLVLDCYRKTPTGYQFGINTIVDETLGDGLQVGGKIYKNGVELREVDGDTLPIGAIVDYDGSVVPEGYEEVPDNTNSYSFAETRVGNWVDGKPLYRRTYVSNLLVSSSVPITIKHNISNVDMIWLDLTASFLYDTNLVAGSYPIPTTLYNGSTMDALTAKADRTNITIYCQSSWGTGWAKYVTVLYTKTTD